MQELVGRMAEPLRPYPCRGGEKPEDNGSGEWERRGEADGGGLAICGGAKYQSTFLVYILYVNHFIF